MKDYYDIDETVDKDEKKWSNEADIESSSEEREDTTERETQLVAEPEPLSASKPLMRISQ